MAKYNGANKLQQAELKRLHASGVSAADASKKTGIVKSCVESFFKSFEKKGEKKPETKTTKANS